MRTKEIQANEWHYSDARSRHAGRFLLDNDACEHICEVFASVCVCTNTFFCYVRVCASGLLVGSWRACLTVFFVFSSLILFILLPNSTTE